MGNRQLVFQRIKQGINKKFCQPIIIYKRRRKYNLPAITIISSDCSGGVLCHDYGLPLDSPTVNLIIEGVDFIKFCKNLEYYLSLKLVDGGRETDSYPIAYCGDIKIKGVHYRSFEDLSIAWERRKARVHKDRIVFLMTERQIIDLEDFAEFTNLKGRKLFLCSEGFGIKSKVVMPLIEFDRMFLFKAFTGHRYIDTEFNFGKWYDIMD